MLILLPLSAAKLHQRNNHITYINQRGGSIAVINRNGATRSHNSHKEDSFSQQSTAPCAAVPHPHAIVQILPHILYANPSLPASVCTSLLIHPRLKTPGPNQHTSEQRNGQHAQRQQHVDHARMDDMVISRCIDGSAPCTG